MLVQFTNKILVKIHISENFTKNVFFLILIFLAAIYRQCYMIFTGDKVKLFYVVEIYFYVDKKEEVCKFLHENTYFKHLKIEY